ncbi:MAG: alkaline phosphatase D family protein [Saprospiraceae bacterium]
MTIKQVCFSGLLAVLLLSCQTPTPAPEGPYFGNGFHNGWADQQSITIWTRLTVNEEMNREGAPFLEVTNAQHKTLRNSTDEKEILAAQIPEGLSLDDMEGACPGANGEVQLSYYPEGKTDARQTLAWAAVDASQNFTRQWQLEGLSPGTKYHLELVARPDAQSPNSDTIQGTFLTPPAADQEKEITFAIVSCHDYPRRDDPINGHEIYPAMLAKAPDFYVHTGDVEYYDKPLPYALTEPLMYFKWDRLFALPYQRSFFSQVTTYFMKDDHDVLSDDAYPGMTYGMVDFERGLEIFDKEQFPSNDTRYKTIRWGKDLQIWLMEGRNFRSNNQDPDGPDKTIWGKAQKEWLFSTINASDATFKIIISPTPILGPDRDKKRDNHSNANFKTEGDEIRNFINQHENVFICNGDRHWQYVSHFEGTNLWEFSSGSGADEHAGGWSQEDVKPEHRFLRVQGGFLMGRVYRSEGNPFLAFQHCDTKGKVVHEEVLALKDGL